MVSKYQYYNFYKKWDYPTSLCLLFYKKKNLHFVKNDQVSIHFQPITCMYKYYQMTKQNTYELISFLIFLILFTW